MSSERGQATLEYVAVIALVTVIVAVGSVATYAPGYANATVGGFRKALCIVAGRECRSLDEQPCVVRSQSADKTLSADIAFVRLQDGRLLLQERLSDGRIRITVTDKSKAGGEVGIGVDADVHLGPLELDASLQANATLLGLYGRGKTYVVRDAGAARKLVRRIEDDRAPEPEVSFHEGGLELDGSATAGVEASVGGKVSGGKQDKKDAKDEDAKDDGTEVGTSALAEAKVGVTAALTRAIGRRVNHRTGETTWYLAADNQVGASAGVTRVGEANAAARGAGMVTVTTDRKGRPVDVGFLGAYSASAGYAMKSGPNGAVGTGRHEVEIHADPDDPAILAALGAWRGSPASPAAMSDLVRSLHDNGRVDKRTYVVDDDEKGASGSIALGLKLGGGYTERTERARLTQASTKPPGGIWERRFDCVEA
ncbi:MAG: hypothetical protein JHC95_11095 [Solirubrobacteraceae bacterium]|nr:hypothetical protein [Solirubrobacteraceae bacterium]